MGVAWAFDLGTGKVQTSSPPSTDSVPGVSGLPSISRTAACDSVSCEAVIDYSAPR
jgi:hypothetical protein